MRPSGTNSVRARWDNIERIRGRPEWRGTQLWTQTPRAAPEQRERALSRCPVRRNPRPQVGRRVESCFLHRRVCKTSVPLERFGSLQSTAVKAGLRYFEKLDFEVLSRPGC